jgi:hypothetical protein
MSNDIKSPGNIDEFNPTESQIPPSPGLKKQLSELEAHQGNLGGEIS